MKRDLRLYDKSNQKKVTSVFASTSIEVATGETVEEDTLSVIPKNSLLLNAQVVVETGTGDAGDAINLMVGVDSFVSDLSLETEGVVDGTVTPLFLPNGGLLHAVGAQAFAGDAKYKIIVEYIETELSTNTYTY